MKNNKGISLITLLVTVIVIIIISSMSIYNGVNLIKDAKRKDAEDRLKAICSAVFKDDTFLDFNDENMHELTEEDFDYMDLLKYYDTDYSIVIKKLESGDSNQKKITYEFTMQEKDSTTQYIYSGDYIMTAEKYNYNIDFDEANGVNRPIITGDMIPIMSDGTLVDDVYKDNWYSYKKGSTNFAKIKTLDDRVFVWIPRFAYNIQSFYNGRISKMVPSTAISIVFLRETTDYMVNDEVMPQNYKIHPAFSVNGVEYSGIWVEQKEAGKLSSLSTVFDDRDKYDIHMLTNTEFGAILYLMHALEDMDEVLFTKDEYVAASLSDNIGKFSTNGGFVTEYNLDEEGKFLEQEIYGDAFYETPWNRLESNYPTTAKPYVIRKLSSGTFDFSNAVGTEDACYRGAIAIK